MAVGIVGSATSGAQSSVSSFNITTSPGTGRAGLVFVVTYAVSTAVDTGVTWNGVSMNLLYSAADTNTEAAIVRAYFLDNVSAGNVTVSRTNNSTVCVGYSVTISTNSVSAEVYQTKTIGGAGTVVTNGNASEAGTAASGEVAVDDGSPGTSSMRFAAIYTGASSPLGAGTNSTSLQTHDATAYGSTLVRETTAGQGSRSVGVATGTTDDYAVVAVAVREKPPVYPGLLTQSVSVVAPTINKTWSTSVAEVSLAAASDPIVHTGHKIRVRARVQSGTIGTLKVALYEGTNNRSGDLTAATLTTSLADYSVDISEANAANISSYADLSLRFWVTGVGPTGFTAEVDQIWLELPAVAAQTVTMTAVLASTASAVAPKVTQSVTGALISRTTTAEAPAVGRSIAAGLITQAVASVAPSRVDQSVGAGLLTQSVSAVAPEKVNSLHADPAVVERFVSVLAPSVSAVVGPSLVERAVSAIAPSRVDQSVAGAVVAQPVAAVAPAGVAQSVSAVLLSQAVSVVAPTRVDQSVASVLLSQPVAAVTPSSVRTAQSVTLVSVVDQPVSAVAPDSIVVSGVPQEVTLTGVLSQGVVSLAPSIPQQVAPAVQALTRSSPAPMVARSVLAVVLSQPVGATAPSGVLPDQFVTLGGVLSQAVSAVAPAVSQRVGVGLLSLSGAVVAPSQVRHSVAPSLLTRAVAVVVPTVARDAATAVGEISLAAASEPTSRTGHAIHVRARVQTGTGRLRLALYEGGINRSGDLYQDVTATLADYTVAISDGAAAQIGSYSNLSIRFWGTAAAARTFEIDQLWLEIPSPLLVPPYYLAGIAPRAVLQAVVRASRW